MGLRWHLIERQAGIYDWSSFLPMLAASAVTGTQVIWDLCHWGVPSWLDIFSDEFVTRFAAFAGAAALLIRERSGAVPFYCGVNEISFWAWVGGRCRDFSSSPNGVWRCLEEAVGKGFAGSNSGGAIGRCAGEVCAGGADHQYCRGCGGE